jgi:putative flippase GtrA
MRIRLPAIRFALVGVLATLVHLIIGTGLIYLALAPLLANICGFLSAFSVSFLGHHHFSFGGHGNRSGDTLIRFVLVAAIGFGINQGVLASLLYAFPSNAMNALIISTLTAAVATFKLSHLWAFRKHPANNKDCRSGQWSSS